MPAPAPLPDQDNIDLGLLNEVIGFRLRRIQNHLTRGFTERMARPDIRPGVFSALALIEANPGLSQTALATEIGFDKATVVAIVDALERQGWAERGQHKGDRRRRALTITEQGRRSLAEMRDICLDNEASIYAALSKAELAQLFALLDKAYAACFSGASESSGER
jgi:DNA-binding MarR family transcriptional regulator